jgi:hypothetical protein
MVETPFVGSCVATLLSIFSSTDLRLKRWSCYVLDVWRTRREKDHDQRYGCHMYVLTVMDSSIRERRPDWEAEVPWPQRLSAQKGRGFARLVRMPGMRLTMIGGKVQ